MISDKRIKLLFKSSTYKSIARRWIYETCKDVKKCNPYFIIKFPLSFLDPFFQQLIYIPFIAEDPKKWVEQHMTNEEINLQFDKESKIELVKL